jgi:RNA polymerase sigma-70 factor (ECF subfamily)
MADLTMPDVTAADATVRLAATGDEAAFARLVAEHHASMARVAFVICGDPELTRDAVQSAWAIAWRRLPDVKDPTRIRAAAAGASNRRRC